MREYRTPTKKVIRKKPRITRRMILIMLFIGLVFAFTVTPLSSVVFANTGGGSNVTGDLENNVNNTLGGINMGDLDQIVNNLENAPRNIFGGSSFSQRVGQILSGEFAEDYPNLFSAILALFGAFVLDILPVIMLIIGVAILSGFFQNLKSEQSGEGVKNIIHFVTYASVVVIVMVVVGGLVIQVSGALNSMRTQMEIIFPILLTLMVAVGGFASAGVYQPAVAVLSNGVMVIFSTVVMPLFIITLVFSVVGHLSPSHRLDKFVSFFHSAFKWIIGIIFTVFLAFLTIQGITAGVHDGISIRAARFTIGSYIPYLGGYLSQGLDLILASSILIKNAVGMAGLYLLVAVVLAPLAKIIIFSLGLKLAAAVTQPIADERISNFLTSINKAFGMLASILIGSAFMYFITVGLVIVTGNVI
ncbi:MAG: stage III sporulation protein AE [Firmicutes bacterium]|nr:stage III sporulation protein AE [Bacillota bacterium]